MVAKWVGDALGFVITFLSDLLRRSIYEDKSEVKSIPVLDTHTPHATYQLGIHDVMAQDVKCIHWEEKLGTIVDVSAFFLMY